MMRREDEVGKGCWRGMIPASILLLSSAIAIATATVLPNAKARQVAVVFNPVWSTQAVAHAIAASGVRMVRNGALNTIVVVELDELSRPDVLYQAGAWLVLDAIAAGGCGAGPYARSLRI